MKASLQKLAQKKWLEWEHMSGHANVFGYELVQWELLLMAQNCTIVLSRSKITFE